MSLDLICPDVLRSGLSSRSVLQGAAAVRAAPLHADLPVVLCFTAHAPLCLALMCTAMLVLSMSMKLLAHGSYRLDMPRSDVLCCRWMTPRMLAITVFNSLYHNIAMTRAELVPPPVTGLLKQCATAELLGWLLEAIVSTSSGGRLEASGGLLPGSAMRAKMIVNVTMRDRALSLLGIVASAQTVMVARLLTVNVTVKIYMPHLESVMVATYMLCNMNAPYCNCNCDSCINCATPATQCD
jgi:hypothetical protein